MRLGRPLALAAAAVLATGITSPAYADSVTPPAPPAPAGDATDSFDLDDVADLIDPNSTYTFSGKGCASHGVPGTVSLAIGNAPDMIALLGSTNANADGSWSMSVDMAEATKKAGGNTLVDPWFVGAKCYYYDGTSSEIDEEGFHLTKAEAKISSEQDLTTKELRNLKADGSGFNPGEEISFMLTPSDEQGNVTEGASGFLMGSTTVDAEGKFSLALSMPAGVPNGYYLITDKSQTDGTANYKRIYKVVDGSLYDYKALGGADDGNDMGGRDDDSDNAVKPQPQQPAPAQNAADKEPAKTAPKKDLAKTGVATPAIAVLAVGMAGAGAGAVALKRRKA